MKSEPNLKLLDSLREPYQNLSTREPVSGNPSQPSLARTRILRVVACSMAGLLIVLAAVAMAPTPSSAAQLSVSIRIGPPPLPVYDQPLCPGPGYIWTPGYWAYDPVDGYYWVPGTWVMAPAPGLLWTPGYWGWSDGFYAWHAGYWGPHVGFYGGINYGFGYTGSGYEGGYWRGGAFYYNRSVNNVNVVNVTNVYNRTVVNNVRVTRVSYNGGPGGLNARPTPAEMTAEHDRHVAATSTQQQHQNLARQDRAQFASVNHGKPHVVATERPGQFQGNNVARAGGGQKVTPHGPNPPQHNNMIKAEHPNSHQSGAANPHSSRNSERPQGRTPSVEPRAVPQAAPHAATPNRNAERPQRPEGRAPSVEWHPAPKPAPHAAAPSRSAERPHPQPQERPSKPPEERKEQRH